MKISAPEIIKSS